MEAFPTANISISVVWISMMDSDIFQAAIDGVKTLPDSRIRFFFDPGQLSGKAIAESLGHAGEVAWDIYLFFPPRTMWEGPAPLPEVYMHQLSDSWADQSRLFQDQKLGEELKSAMSELMKQYEGQ